MAKINVDKQAANANTGGGGRVHQDAQVRELHDGVEEDVGKEDVLPVDRLRDCPLYGANSRAPLRVVGAPDPVLPECLRHPAVSG